MQHVTTGVVDESIVDFIEDPLEGAVLVPQRKGPNSFLFLTFSNIAEVHYQALFSGTAVEGVPALLVLSILLKMYGLPALKTPLERTHELMAVDTRKHLKNTLAENVGGRAVQKAGGLLVHIHE